MSERLTTQVPDEKSALFGKKATPRLVEFNAIPCIATAYVVGELYSKRSLGRLGRLRAFAVTLSITNSKVNVGEMYKGDARLTLIALGRAGFVAMASKKGDLILAPSVVYVSCVKAAIELPDECKGIMPVNGWLTRRMVNVTAMLSNRWRHQNVTANKVEYESIQDTEDTISERGKKGELW